MKKPISILLLGILVTILGCTKNEPNGNGGSGSSTNNNAPTCTITSPQNGASFSLSDNIPVTVSATDPDGTIAEVKLSIDDMEYHTATSSPYNFTITPGIASSGTHTIKAVAKDNDGASTESSIVIIISGNPSGNNVAPTCIITTPQNGLTFTYDENINVSVFAEDSDGTIEKVSLYIDNVGYSEMTAFPYNFTIVSGVMSPGTHTIKAIAKDNGGSNGESYVTITIEEPATESPDFVTFSDGQIPPTWQSAAWHVDNTGGYDDIYSLKVVGEGSVMTTKTIQGNGQLEFYIKGVDIFNKDYNRSLNDLYSYLKLYIDGKCLYYYTSQSFGSWTKYTIDLCEGSHTFVWEYIGKYSDDCCQIDVIRFTHNTTHFVLGTFYQGGYICYLDSTREHGLIISENDLGNYNWEDANSACNNYSAGQNSDWRMPTKSEAYSIVSCIGRYHLFEILPLNHYFWTSTYCNNDYEHGYGYYIVCMSKLSEFTYDGSSCVADPQEVHSTRAIRSF